MNNYCAHCANHTPPPTVEYKGQKFHEACFIEFKTKCVYAGYTRKQLQDAFEQVRDPNDWKAPIDKVIGMDAAQVTMRAIEFFTATQPMMTYAKRGGKVRVQSIGYRLGPAGDH